MFLLPRRNLYLLRIPCHNSLFQLDLSQEDPNAQGHRLNPSEGTSCHSISLKRSLASLHEEGCLDVAEDRLERRITAIEQNVKEILILLKEAGHDGLPQQEKNVSKRTSYL